MIRTWVVAAVDVSRVSGRWSMEMFTPSSGCLIETFEQWVLERHSHRLVSCVCGQAPVIAVHYGDCDTCVISPRSYVVKSIRGVVNPTTVPSNPCSAETVLVPVMLVMYPVRSC
eukprot:scpid79260/ scgid31467/ 